MEGREARSFGGWRGERRCKEQEGWRRKETKSKGRWARVSRRTVTEQLVLQGKEIEYGKVGNKRGRGGKNGTEKLRGARYERGRRKAEADDR